MLGSIEAGHPGPCGDPAQGRGIDAPLAATPSRVMPTRPIYAGMGHSQEGFPLLPPHQISLFLSFGMTQPCFGKMSATLLVGLGRNFSPT